MSEPITTCRVLLEAGNPHDFENGALEALADNLNATGGFVAIPIRRDETGYGVTFYEVLRVWIEVTGGIEATRQTVTLATAAISWLRDRWRADQELTGKARPRVFTLYDEHDQVVREVKIDLPDGEPVDEPGPQRPTPRRPHG